MKTCEQVVQELPWRWTVQGKIALIGGLGYMFDAWDVALNGYLTPLVGHRFALSNAERGSIASANLIGMAIGAVLWGTIADRIGRKKAFSFTLLIFALFSVAGAASPNFETFIVLRFLAGIGLGGCVPVDFAMVGEFSPKKQRGRVVATIGLWWPIGATFAGVASTLLLPLNNNWRWILLTMVLPAMLLVWIRRDIPESPLYLARMGREVEARAVVDDLVRRTGAPVTEYEVPPVAILTGPATKRSLLQKIALAGTQFVTIWRSSPLITAVIWTLSISILLVYYAALTWMPSVLRAQGYSDRAAFAGTTTMTLVGIVGVLVSIALVDIIGRKWVIAMSAPLAGVVLVMLGYSLERGGGVTLYLAIFGFLIQVAIPVLYTYTSELYPTELRASGFGWTSTVSRIATGLSPIVFGVVLWPLVGLTWTFVILAAFVLVAVLMTAFGAPETRGRELDAIADEATDVARVETEAG